MEIVTAQLAYEALRGVVSSDCEEFWALALGPRKEILSSRMLFRGTVDSCLVHPRDVFRFGLVCNASALLVAHNHPSGETIPSMEDLRFTRQLVRASVLMEIPVVDHIIVTAGGFSSMRTEGWCAFDESAVADVWRTYAGGAAAAGARVHAPGSRVSAPASESTAVVAYTSPLARAAHPDDPASGPHPSSEWWVTDEYPFKPARTRAKWIKFADAVRIPFELNGAPVALADAERALLAIAKGELRVH